MPGLDLIAGTANRGQAARKRFGAILLLALATVAAGPARSDGSFLQADIGPENQSFVATSAVDALSFGLNMSWYEDGRTAVLSATYAVDLGTLGSLKFGPTLGFQSEDGAPDETEIGARLSLDRYTPTSFGAVYGLAEIASIDDSWFLLGQVTLQRGLGFEVSRGGSTTYTETTIAIQQQQGDGPLRLRLGYRVEDDEVFVGISFNTF